MQQLGEKIRKLRTDRGLTREAFCGDESQLSTRQLARIEKSQSIPTLAKVQFIAKQLALPVSELIDPEQLVLPKRYKELKYYILRQPTYMNEQNLSKREAQFDDIFENYYDQLPEEEQLIIDLLQSRFDVYQSGDINYGKELLQEYIAQIRKKKSFSLNDIFLIDLYLTCGLVSNFQEELFNKAIFDCFTNKLLKLEEELDFKDLFLLNNVLLTSIFVGLAIKEYQKVRRLLDVCRRIMTITQDFQRMPIYYMYEWRYSLFFMKDSRKAAYYYRQSLIYAKTLTDAYLVQRLKESWDNDQEA
ncbi:Cro/Cl family transcriptional regulator [Streptococcus penaeicida]|uniref:Cro/Cl family transcriptional regulator n=1 Tax=Streptococcus penaeicida TaxID=1765960 RepID=A0A2N8LED7_9STRE|nr:helix-turn-helix domain-containing protein [Streptococcus penaeicida]PND48537.1 Cro/Cl family transcriptional regulator [Streptococcus penaeicida]